MARTPDSSGKTGSEGLARIVRDRREQLGLTRQELADATGIPYPTIAQIETAYRGVSPARLGVIARVLGLDPKELYDVLASEGADAEARPVPPESAPPQPSPSPGPPPVAPRRQPPGRGRARRSAAPAQLAGGWHVNPGFAAPMAPMAASVARDEAPLPPKPPADRTAEVVEQAVELLSQLPVDERIDALGLVHKRALERIVDERIERTE